MGLKGLDTLISRVARTREELARIGLENLPESTWQHKHLLDIGRRGVLLDEFALDVWSALQERTVSVPNFLWPGSTNSIYRALIDRIWGQPDSGIARKLFEQGFKELNAKDSLGWTPLLVVCVCDHEETWPTAKFLLDNGAHLCPEAPWICARGQFSDEWTEVPVGIQEQLSAPLKDGCSCFCSTSGCSPTTLSLRNSKQSFLVRRHMLINYLSLMLPEQAEMCLSEAYRLEVFERLGMAHTCCRTEGSPKNTSMEAFAAGSQLEHSERAEMQDEDKTLSLVLEEFMGLFQILRAVSDERNDFRSAWWAALDLLLPPTEGKAPSLLELDPKIYTDDGEYGEMNAESGVDAHAFRIIVWHYASLSPLISNFIEGERTAGFSKEVGGYLLEAGVAEPVVEWLRGRRNLRYHDSWSAEGLDGRYRNYCDDRNQDTESSFLRERVIPLTTAAVIRDIDAGRRIPTDLYDLLVSERVLQDGKLPSLEQPEGTAAEA